MDSAQPSQQQEAPQFQSVQEKIAYVNQQIPAAAELVKQGDAQFNQFMFQNAKGLYIQASKILMALMKLTKDDANFQQYIGQQLRYSLDKAERCTQNVNTQMLAKNSAGYGANNLQKDAISDLKRDLLDQAKAINDQETQNLKELLEQQDAREQLAEQRRQEMFPSPPQNPVAGAGGPQADNNANAAGAKPQEAPKEAPKAKIDPQIAQTLQDSILDADPNVKWEDVKGLADVKKVLNETIVLPTMRPDIFSGLYAPSKGILLYGPPGTGKTLLAKAVATECKSTFFSISASTLTSKWMGEGEKLMRGLFAMALEKAPSVIFFDEIDSIMGARGGNEHEASRRLKTEFLVQFDGVSGAAQSSDKNLLVLAATNRPQDLDEAALRRLTRRIYIPLPDNEAREAILSSKLDKVNHELDEAGVAEVVHMTEGYSCADMQAMIREAAMQPVREIPPDQLMQLKDKAEIRKLQVQDFAMAVKAQPPSVSAKSIGEFDAWRQDKGQVS